MGKRIFSLKIIVMICLALLLSRAVQLQLVQGDYYYQLSEGNRTSLRPINAPRGRIIDGGGNILVSNKMSYSLYLLPNEVPPEQMVEELLDRLHRLTGLDAGLLRDNYQRSPAGNPSSPILLKRNLSQEAMVIIKEKGDELPGLLVKESSRRDYVYDDLAAHSIGYVGEIGLEELKRLNAEGHYYRGGDIIGVTGLEKSYEHYLRGQEGIELLEVNSKGEKVRSLGTKPPVPGNDLLLNLDLNLQRFVEKLLREQFEQLREKAAGDDDLHPPTGAAAIVMDPNTGAVLALTSYPDYNPNDFVRGLTVEEYQQINQNPLDPLNNRITRAQVPPGSIFKLVTAAAAIENLGIDRNTIFTDQYGKFTIGEYQYRNWFYRPEGELDFIRAIARSNNVVFYQLGYRLYQEYHGEKLAETAREFGLGSITGVDLPGEKPGLVPDESWKRENRKRGWYPGDSVNLSIGQGFLKTTPLQLIDMICAIANGGTLYQPFIVKQVVAADGEVVLDNRPKVVSRLPFKRSTINTLKEGMSAVTGAVYADGTRGTAAGVFKDFPVKVAGKTGTAQTGTSQPSHGFFAGFAPVDRPEIAVLVFLENGNSSAYTLPIAADIFSRYFGFEDELTKDEEEGEGGRDKQGDEAAAPGDSSAEKGGGGGQDLPGASEPEQNKLLNFLKEVFSNEE